MNSYKPRESKCVKRIFILILNKISRNWLTYSVHLVLNVLCFLEMIQQTVYTHQCWSLTVVNNAKLNLLDQIQHDCCSSIHWILYYFVDCLGNQSLVYQLLKCKQNENVNSNSSFATKEVYLKKSVQDHLVPEHLSVERLHHCPMLQFLHFSTLPTRAPLVRRASNIFVGIMCPVWAYIHK